MSDAPVPPPQPPPPEPPTEFHIGDEFGTARRSLPPAGIVLICIAAVAVVVAIFAFKQRPKPQGAGAIDFVAAAEVPGQNMILTAITMTLRNTTDRPLWIKTLKAQLTTADGKNFDDEAASAVDLDRYYQAFPALKESSEPPISPETKLLAGAKQRGTIIVSFKVTKEAFDQRKSLAVSIQPYDQVLPVVLK
jgi:Tfp pilus assembly protein PilX